MPKLPVPRLHDMLPTGGTRVEDSGAADSWSPESVLPKPISISMALSSVAHPPLGETVRGKYLLEEVVGLGGMGTVIAARHLHLQQRVAIKFLENSSSPRAMSRFFREAQACAKLRQEHVARVMDVDTLPDGTPFIVMEYLEGRDLAHLLRDHGPLPPVKVVDYLMQALEALAEAHKVGIVHRDLKPSNLFLAGQPDGTKLLKVLDFGISKVAASDGEGFEGLTQTKTLLGSPSYMSPEQVSNPKGVDGRTDIWSFGVTCYELLTGRLPFRGGGIAELLSAIHSHKAESLRSLRPEIPEELERVVQRCLQRNVKDRYRTVAELAADLAPLGSFASQRSLGCIQRIVNPRPVDLFSSLSAELSLPKDMRMSVRPKRPSQRIFGRATPRYLSAFALTIVLVSLMLFWKYGQAPSSVTPHSLQGPQPTTTPR